MSAIAQSGLGRAEDDFRMEVGTSVHVQPTFRGRNGLGFSPILGRILAVRGERSSAARSVTSRFVEPDLSVKKVGRAVADRPPGVNRRDDLARIGLVEAYEAAAIEDASGQPAEKPHDL